VGQFWTLITNLKSLGWFSEVLAGLFEKYYQLFTFIPKHILSFKYWNLIRISGTSRLKKGGLSNDMHIMGPLARTVWNRDQKGPSRPFSSKIQAFGWGSLDKYLWQRLNFESNRSSVKWASKWLGPYRVLKGKKAPFLTIYKQKKLFQEQSLSRPNKGKRFLGLFAKNKGWVQNRRIRIELTFVEAPSSPLGESDMGIHH